MKWIILFTVYYLKLAKFTLSILFVISVYDTCLIDIGRYQWIVTNVKLLPENKLILLIRYWHAQPLIDCNKLARHLASIRPDHLKHNVYSL